MFCVTASSSNFSTEKKSCESRIKRVKVEINKGIKFGEMNHG